MRASTPLEEKILGLIEPAAAELGYGLVRIRLSGLRRKRLQIMAERVADGHMGIDDCQRLSRAISPVLEAHDPVKGEYDLEISSPGIDRPLVRLEDFARFAGHDAKVELGIGIEGRRRFQGVIAGVEGGDVRLATEQGEARFPFTAIANARLILTDRLIEEDLRRAKMAEAADHPLPGGEGAGGGGKPRTPKSKAKQG